MRPGRLDRLLYVGPPDAKGREEILAIRLAKMSVEPGLDIQHLAALVCIVYNIQQLRFNLRLQTEGCSGAEIVALCQEAALITMKEDMDAAYVSLPLNLKAFDSEMCLLGVTTRVHHGCANNQEADYSGNSRKLRAMERWLWAWWRVKLCIILLVNMVP